ncbi:MAG: methyltransferase domain-containing protein [Candidatus Krumholzibacteria bacterium]|nr:methyltransferase domain-containing protein [Candidatus Krumholzibacteria bacterium]
MGSGLFAARLGIGYGAEPAGGMAELARKRGIEVEIAAAEDLPYADGRFDAVLLGTVLSYVKDRQRAVREAFRILKPGGSVVVSFLAREGSYAMLYDLAAIRGRHDRETAPEYPYPIQFIRGARWISTAEVDALLKNAGFTDLEYAQTLTMHPRYSNDRVEEPAAGYEKGDYIVVRGRKP